MKKGELLSILQGIPDDAEIVIGPYREARCNRRLRAEDMTFVREPRNLPCNAYGQPYGPEPGVIYIMDNYLIINSHTFD